MLKTSLRVCGVCTCMLYEVSPHSAQHAVTQRWAEHYRCCSSSLWRVLHRQLLQISSMNKEQHTWSGQIEDTVLYLLMFRHKIYPNVILYVLAKSGLVFGQCLNIEHVIWYGRTEKIAVIRSNIWKNYKLHWCLFIIIFHFSF